MSSHSLLRAMGGVGWTRVAAFDESLIAMLKLDRRPYNLTEIEIYSHHKIFKLSHVPYCERSASMWIVRNIQER